MNCAPQSRWQFRCASEKRWEWLPDAICNTLTAAANEGMRIETIFHPLLGEFSVDLKLQKTASGINGEVRCVPGWWGEDANLAAGILVACEDLEGSHGPGGSCDSGVQVLFGVEDRPWWTEKQAGPFWGFVEQTDPDLPSAMAREAAEETLGILGSEDEICGCLRSDDHSTTVCRSPWHQGPDGPGLEILRIVNLGSLTRRERKAIQQSFRYRRSLAVAAAATAATAMQSAAQGVPGAPVDPVSPASHLEVEELQWTSANSLFGSLQDGRTPLIGRNKRPLRGFVTELLQEGLRWHGGERFREFCTRSPEVLQPMPHFRALLPRLISESSRIAFVQPRCNQVSHLPSATVWSPAVRAQEEANGHVEGIFLPNVVAMVLFLVAITRLGHLSLAR